MNTGGPASEKTLLDEFAGQALANSNIEEHSGKGLPDRVAIQAYEIASAMLAEKARREATGKDCLPVHDHSPDAGKLVKPATLLQVVANERDLALDRVIALEAANMELVEALDALVGNVNAMENPKHRAEKARAILAKHKGAA